ncbi:uncharacterized protein LOC110026278 [Phalaenopsis equestris]|uniref:uncharacterized protein LOC110026278 n=1 Tax=Phalaenopsis equestris TaxID=78828 RepID=UPI0009E4A0E0|nr:uncharacterized protein LOC110026278 [Phalaenopsis equestris]
MATWLAGEGSPAELNADGWPRRSSDASSRRDPPQGRLSGRVKRLRDLKSGRMIGSAELRSGFYFLNKPSDLKSGRMIDSAELHNVFYLLNKPSEALSHREWRKAVNEEVAALKKSGTWIVSNLPKDTKPDLLALEEKMGSVSTALPEEVLSKCLQVSTYRINKLHVPGISGHGDDDFKCSVCQEEYMVGEELGRLSCKHHYHVTCIQQWLRLKNWCPICKAPALS